MATGRRSRRPGGGRQGHLATMRDKLLFLLYYFKIYSTFEVLGTQFNMVRLKAHENLYKLTPVWYQTLVHLRVMPPRQFTTPEKLVKALGGIETFVIEVTERPHRRPQDDQKQREHDSSKKNTHRQKHCVLNA